MDTGLPPGTGNPQNAPSHGPVSQPGPTSPNEPPPKTSSPWHLTQPGAQIHGPSQLLPASQRSTWLKLVLADNEPYLAANAISTILLIVACAMAITFYRETREAAQRSLVLHHKVTVPEEELSEEPNNADSLLLEMIDNTGGASLEALETNYRAYAARLASPNPPPDQGRYTDAEVLLDGDIVGDIQEVGSENHKLYSATVQLPNGERKANKVDYFWVFCKKKPSPDALGHCIVYGYVSDRTMKKGDATFLVIDARAILDDKEAEVVHQRWLRNNARQRSQ